MGFKPIFEEERAYLRDKTGIDLPTDCWRNSSKIYLDFTQPAPYIQFKVADGEINIVNNNVDGYKRGNKMLFLPHQKKIPDLIAEYGAEIERKFQKAVNDTVDFVNTHQDYRYSVSFSGGKDSLVIWQVWQAALPYFEKEPDWFVVFCNTTNDTHDTYRYLKETIPADRLQVLNPEIGFHTWLKDVKHYLIPNKRMRNCCSTYKEGQMYKTYDNDIPTINITGVRKHESVKRQGYERVMDYKWRKEHFGSSTLPKNWINLAPIVDFTDEEIWLLILMKEWRFNPIYKYGFHRAGCLVCCFQSDYVDLLTSHYYPKAWKRWQDILEKHYEMYDIKTRLKWSLTEWRDGQWKQALSKDHLLASKAPTAENIHALAELKGISDEMAEKYFRKVCSCGKKCTPTEVAMFYKTQGRMEGEEDNRTVLCQKCLCEQNGWTKQEYMDKANEFRDGGCNLF